MEDAVTVGPHGPIYGNEKNEGRTEDGGVVCGIGAVTTETSQLTA